MPSNKDLIEQANELAEKLGEQVTTEGLNNSKLSELVKGLRARWDAPPTVEETPAAAKVLPYAISKGKALTTKRGILGEGQEIKAEDVAGGLDTINRFVKSGHISKDVEI